MTGANALLLVQHLAAQVLTAAEVCLCVCVGAVLCVSYASFSALHGPRLSWHLLGAA